MLACEHICPSTTTAEQALIATARDERTRRKPQMACLLIHGAHFSTDTCREIMCTVNAQAGNTLACDKTMLVCEQT